MGRTVVDAWYQASGAGHAWRRRAVAWAVALAAAVPLLGVPLPAVADDCDVFPETSPGTVAPDEDPGGTGANPLSPDGPVCPALQTPDGAVAGAAGGPYTVSVEDTVAAENSGPAQGATARFVVRVTPPAPVALAVTYSTVDGTAEAGDDYVAATGSTVEVPAGAAAAVVSVPLVDDTEPEENETFAVVLAQVDGEGGELPTDPEGRTGAATVLDDDAASGAGDNAAATARVTGTSVDEADAPVDAVFVIALDEPATEPVDVDYETVDQSARAGSDYTAAAGTARIEAGQTTATVDVPVLADDVGEATEAFKLAVRPSPESPHPAVVVEPIADGLIVDDDGGITLAIGDAGVVAEGTAPDPPAEAVFPVTLEGATFPIAVPYRVVADAGTATPGADYAPAAGVLLFGLDQPATQEVRVPVVPDADHEPGPPETFQIDLGAPVEPLGGLSDPETASEVVVVDGSGVAEIMDDDAPVSTGVQVFVGPAAVMEPGDLASDADDLRFPVVIVGQHDGLNLRYSTSPDPLLSAEPGGDYTAVTDRVVTIPPAPSPLVPVPGFPAVQVLGDGSAGEPSPLTVAVHGDALSAPDDAPVELLGISIDPVTPDPAVTIVAGVAAGAILDDDAPAPPPVPTTLPVPTPPVPTTLPTPPATPSVPTTLPVLPLLSPSTTTTAPPTTTTTLAEEQERETPPTSSGGEDGVRGADVGAVARGAATPSGNGYWVVAPDGFLDAFGDADTAVAGAPESEARIIGFTSDGSREGGWALDEAGGVHARGTAPFLGSLPGRRASGAEIGHARVVDIDATGDGRGFVILDEAGGVHAFGSVPYLGSIPARRAAGAQIGPSRFVGVALTGTGEGYWILDEAGGVHAFGDAGFHGSLPGLLGSRAGGAAVPARAIAASSDGYWVLDAQGGIFTFGDAPFRGSLPGRRDDGASVGPAPATDIVAPPSASGYWIMDAMAGVHAFGQAGYHGSVVERHK